MNLKDYFENTKGVGVLATADADGKVNVAVYARPHFLDPEDDDSPTFIMNERLSYANVQANPMRRISSSRRATDMLGSGLR